MKPALTGCRLEEIARTVERPVAGFAVASVASVAAVEAVCAHRAQIALAERPAAAGADRKTTRHSLIDQHELHDTRSFCDESTLCRPQPGVALAHLKGPEV